MVVRGMPAFGPRALLGVNAPYLQGDYGHDLAPSARHPDWPVSFDAMHAYRPIIEARALGLGAVRIWLCENAEGLLVDEHGHIQGVHADLLSAIDVHQEAAHLHGIALQWTLLDGNAVAREADPVTRSILADADQAKRFAEHVVRPIAERLDPKITVSLEIINEPETATADCMADSPEAQEGVVPVSWDEIATACRHAAAAAASEGCERIGSGTMHVFLPELWKRDHGLNVVDVHVYHDDGGLPSRADLAKYTDDERLLDPSLPLIASECGIPKSADYENLINYVHNADDAGYDAVFLWQLSGDLVDTTSEKRPVTPLGWRIRDLAMSRRT